jgi:hypothetical protein
MILERQVRPRQQEAAEFMADQMLQEQQREVGLSMQPGAGKSISQQIHAVVMSMRAGVRLTISLAPQLCIKQGLVPTQDCRWVGLTGFNPPLEGDSIAVEQRKWRDLRATPLRDDESGRTALYGALHAEVPNQPHVAATYQALVRWTQDPDFLPRDLSDVLFFYDEGHHVGEDNCIGALAKEIARRNGRRCFVSATLYRRDGKLLLSPDTPVFSVSIAQAQADPDDVRYCPKDLWLRTESIPYVDGVSYAERVASAVIDFLERDGWRKSLIILKPGNSLAVAEQVARASFARRPDIRVVNAVGDANKEIVSRTLAREQAAARGTSDGQPAQLSDSKVDIFISCGRFKEGSDWPFCSHVYDFAPTDSIAQYIQHAGRALRSKRGILGYPPDYDPELAVYTLAFLACPVEQDLRDCHFDRSYLAVAMMADWRVAHDYVDDLRRMLARPSARSGRENQDAWRTLLAAFSCTQEEGKQAIGILARAHAMLLHDGIKPVVPAKGCPAGFTSAKIDEMFVRMNLPQESLVLARDLLALRSPPRVMMNHLKGLVRKLRAEPARRNNWRWVRAELHAVFAEVVRKNETYVVPDLATPGIAFITQVHGGVSAENIGRALAEASPWDITFSRVRAFQEERGHVSFDDAVPAQAEMSKWLERQRDEHRRNVLPEDRRDRLLEVGIDLVRAWSQDDRLAELIRRCKADPEWVPHEAYDRDLELGKLAWELRVRASDVRRKRVEDEVPWFEWDTVAATVRRGLLAHGAEILHPGTVGCSWYEPYHVAHRLGGLKGVQGQLLSAGTESWVGEWLAVDDAYCAVYKAAWQERVDAVRATPRESTAYAPWMNPFSKSQDLKQYDMFSRLLSDRLLDFERASVFSDPAFTFMLDGMCKHVPTTLVGAREADIRPDSLRGYWWKGLPDEKRTYYRTKVLHG